jgi:hypothetical protein
MVNPSVMSNVSKEQSRRFMVDGLLGIYQATSGSRLAQCPAARHRMLENPRLIAADGAKMFRRL